MRLSIFSLGAISACAAIGLASSGLCTTIYADLPAVGVRKGLDIRVTGDRTIEVASGTCVIAGKDVSVETPTSLEIAPPPTVSVQGEKTELSDKKPVRWSGGTRLKQITPRSTPLPGCLKPGSIVVRSADGKTEFTRDEDFLVDDYWGNVARTPTGRIGADTIVSIDYEYGKERIDTVQVCPDGKVSLKQGTAALASPIPPEPDEGCLPLANVYIRYHAAKLAAPDIYPIGPPLPPPTPEATAKNTRRVAKTRAKLAAGKPVCIGFWGDSVTCGGDASCAATRFPDAFVAELQKKYPNSEITFFNAGIGGSSTLSRLKNLQQDVLDKKPDLVCIEFVNNMGFSPELMRKHYYSAIDQIHAIGAEVILITPHFTMPSWMGFSDENPRGKESRAACLALREIAEEKQVGLADAARQWEHLWKTGIPYPTLLFNRINHPDDRGHRIFVDALMESFP